MNRKIGCTLLLGLLGLPVACGIPVDAKPRDLPLFRPTSTLASQQPAPSAAQGQGIKLYFISDVPGRPSQLRAVDRKIAPDPDSVIKELLSGVGATDDHTLRTAIPVDTQLRSTPTLVDGTLTVDLNQAFFTSKGDLLVAALAQLVFTVNGLEGVTQVRVLVEGELRDLPRGNGTRQRRTFVGSDFAALDPSSQPDYVIAPSPVLASSSTATPITTPTTLPATVPPTSAA